MGNLFWRAIGAGILVVRGGTFGYGALILYVRTRGTGGVTLAALVSGTYYGARLR